MLFVPGNGKDAEYGYSSEQRITGDTVTLWIDCRGGLCFSSRVGKKLCVTELSALLRLMEMVVLGRSDGRGVRNYLGSNDGNVIQPWSNRLLSDDCVGTLGDINA